MSPLQGFIAENVGFSWGFVGGFYDSARQSAFLQ